MGSPVNLIGSRREKNILINASFGLFQRTLSYSNNTNTFAYVADRWGFFPGGAMAHQIQRQQHSNPVFGLGHGRHGIAIQRSAGAGATGASFQFNQTMERRDSQQYAGKYVTLSFNARRGANFSGINNAINASILTTQTNGDTAYITGWAQVSGAGTNSFVLGLTNPVSRFSVTGFVPANTVGLAVNFDYIPTGVAGANDYFILEDVQLEEGQAATEFETRGRSFAEELMLCQRYYEKSYDLETPPNSNTSVGLNVRATTADSAGNHYFTNDFKVQKRTAPACIVYAAGGGPNSVSGFSNNASQTGHSFNSFASCTVGGSSQYGFFAYAFSYGSYAPGRVSYQWTANAEM